MISSRNFKLKLYRSIAGIILLSAAMIIAWYFHDNKRFSKIGNDDRFYNLTKNNVLWDLFIGHSPDCSGIPCHVRGDLPEIEFSRKTSGPIREFPIVGYKKGQLVYQRVRFQVPGNFDFKGSESWSLFSVYIWAQKYRVFIDNAFVHAGTAGPLVVSLPTEALNSGQTISIGIESDPGSLPYQGLSNLNSVVIAPTALAEELRYIPKEIRTADALWRFLPPMTAAVIISTIFLLSTRHVYLLYLALFLFSSASPTFFSSEYGERIFSRERIDATLIKQLGVISQAFLFCFTAYFFEMKRKKILSVVAFATATATALTTYFTGHWIASYINSFVNTLIPLLSYGCGSWIAAQLLTGRKRISENSKVYKHSFYVFLVAFITQVLITTEYILQDFFNEHILTASHLNLFNNYVASFGFSLLVALRWRESEEEQEKLATAASIAKERQQATNQAIRVISHDIKRPLAVLSSILTKASGSLLKEEDVPPAFNATKQLEALIRDLSLIGNQKGIYINQTFVCLEKLVNEAFETVRQHPLLHQARFYKEFESDTNVFVDEEKFVRVLSNLFENSLDAMQSKQVAPCSLGVTAKVYKPDEIIITVWNYGTQVPSEILTRMFEPFVTFGKNHGTGLGLSIVHEVISAHMGSVSYALRNGNACFDITLPARSILSHQLSRVRDFVEVRDKPKVILVEDDPFIIDEWQLLLGEVELVSFSDATSLGKYLRADRSELPQIVLSDYFLANDETAEHVIGVIKRSHWAKIPIILISDYSLSNEEASEFLLVLSKRPIPYDALLNLPVLRN